MASIDGVEVEMNTTWFTLGNYFGM